jgi:hypothetical protein
MTERENADIERSLARLAPKPVPDGMRQRILSSAYEAGGSRALTRGRLVTAAVCAAVLAAILTADRLVARRESARWAALLDGRSPVQSIEDPASILAEIMGTGAEKDVAALRSRMLASTRIRPQVPEMREALKRLKGWLEYETPEDPH